LGIHTFVAPPSVSKAQLVETPKTPVAMTTYLIRQQIHMKIHDILYQVLKQLADIVKPTVHNVVQQVKVLEAVWAKYLHCERKKEA